MVRTLRRILAKADHETPASIPQHVVNLFLSKLTGNGGVKTKVSSNKEDKSCVGWRETIS